MTSPARRLRDALEPLAALSFHSEPSLASYAALGLTDFAPAYVWSRSSVLGVAEPSVVAAAFGVFEPELIRTSLRTARASCSLDEIREATQTGAGAAAREVLGDIDAGDIRGVVVALRRGADAADLMGRPLFAGNQSWTWPDDVYRGLWRAATVWRELRGDSHLAACVAEGISGVQANVLNELDAGYELGEYTSTRAWSRDDIRAAADQLHERGLVADGVLTDGGRALREELESRTDAAVAPAIDAVRAELDVVVGRADSWAQLTIARGWFPDDERKRAAG